MVRAGRRIAPPPHIDYDSREELGWRSNCQIFGGQRARFSGGMAQQKDDTLLEAQRSKLKPPPMFKVMLLNDDYTPMEFVVVVLRSSSA